MNVETREYLKSMQQAGKNSRKDSSESRENISENVLLLDSFAAAKLLGFTRQFFYELSSSGRLGPMPIYFGKRSRWSRFELENWVKAGCPNREKWLGLLENEIILS